MRSVEEYAFVLASAAADLLFSRRSLGEGIGETFKISHLAINGLKNSDYWRLCSREAKLDLEMETGRGAATISAGEATIAIKVSAMRKSCMGVSFSASSHCCPAW